MHFLSRPNLKQFFFLTCYCVGVINMVKEPRSPMQTTNLKTFAPRSPLQTVDLRMYSPKFVEKISFGKATSSDHNPMIIGGHIREIEIDGTRSRVRNNFILKVLGSSSLSCKDLRALSYEELKKITITRELLDRLLYGDLIGSAKAPSVETKMPKCSKPPKGRTTTSSKRNVLAWK